MRSTITLNGKNSSEIAGLLIQTLPPISKPLMRTQIEEIDGRDGDIVTKLGFSAYKKEFTIGLYGDYDVDEVIGYFNSEGTVTFSNEPDKYYYYQIVDQIDFEKLIRFKTATVTMHCQPFKYSTIETPEIFENVENLVSIPDFTKTTNGITVNVENGVISVSGTGSAATEFYIPITSLTLSEGEYVLRALGTGTSPEACSVRVIYNSPSAANSFGGTYTTLQNNTTVTITATITQDKTYNYIYLYITPNMRVDFTLDLRITVAEGLVSGEGNFINLQETSLASFNRFDLKGDTDQTNYSGKNLSPYPYYSGSSYVGRGIRFTAASDGSVTLNGENDNTANSAYFIYYNTSSPLQLEAGTYYFIPPSNTNVGYVMYDGTSYYDFSSWNNYSRTFPSAKSIQQIYIQVRKGDTTTFNNLKIYPMLTTLPSQTVADYEPYVGGTASPNPAYPQDVQVTTGEQTVIVSGKNLYNLTSGPTIRSGVTGVGTTEYFTMDGTVSSAGDRLVFNECTLPAGTYTATTYCDSGGIVGSVNFCIYKKNTWMQITPFSAMRFFSSGIGTSKTVTFTLSEETSLWFSAYLDANVSFENLKGRFQLEQGSIATDFKPHKGQSYTINLGNTELCKIGTYQDYIHKDGDDWYLHKEIGKEIFDGTRDVVFRVLTDTINSAECGIGEMANHNPKVYSTHFRWINQDSADAGVHIYAYWGSGGIKYYLPNTIATTKAEWQAWLAANPDTVYYPLATPTDTKITDSTLLAQLEPLTSQAYSYNDETNLVSSSSNLSIVMSVEAIRANKAAITNSGNTTAKPVLTIYGAGDIGVYLNGFQVFKVALGDEGYITIDTNLMEAYKDTPDNLKNRLVDGDYTNFVLLQGESQITFSGSVDRCVIENYSRWL